MSLLSNLGYDAHLIACAACKGSGEVLCEECGGGGTMETNYCPNHIAHLYICPTCHGSNECRTCDGWGEVECFSTECTDARCVESWAELGEFLAERDAQRSIQ